MRIKTETSRNNFLLQFIEGRETINRNIQTLETALALDKLQAGMFPTHLTWRARGWHVNQLVSDNSI